MNDEQQMHISGLIAWCLVGLAMWYVILTTLGIA